MSRSVTFRLVVLFLASAVMRPGLGAAPRTTVSGDYSIMAESTDASGGRIKDGPGDIYRIDASIGGVVGLSVVGSPAIVLKAGYAGQLYDVTALVVSATPAMVSETATRQLSGVRLLDDWTLLAVSAPAINWSVFSGPITSISAAGVATAATVYQNTIATVQGLFEGKTGSLALTVLNAGQDDFGSDAADLLDDAWQVLHFGQPPPTVNPQFGASGDPDGDGHNNHFEFIAGLTPTGPASRFRLRIDAVSGQPGHKSILFGPFLTGRDYTVESRASLFSGIWTEVDSAAGDDSIEHTVTDADATGRTKFYRVLVAKP